MIQAWWFYSISCLVQGVQNQTIQLFLTHEQKFISYYVTLKHYYDRSKLNLIKYQFFKC